MTLVADLYTAQPFWIWLGVGVLLLAVEAMFSTVPAAIGKEGVSKVYGESNVGGLTVVGKVVLAR